MQSQGCAIEVSDEETLFVELLMQVPAEDRAPVLRELSQIAQGGAPPATAGPE